MTGVLTKRGNLAAETDTHAGRTRSEDATKELPWLEERPATDLSVVPSRNFTLGF